MDDEPRLAQLARLLGCARVELAGPGASARVESSVGRLAEGLFAEAAASDDVLSADGAIAYLELRLAYFGDLLTPAAAAAVREQFRQLAARWG